MKEDTDWPAQVIANLRRRQGAMQLPTQPNS